MPPFIPFLNLILCEAVNNVPQTAEQFFTLFGLASEENIYVLFLGH